MLHIVIAREQESLAWIDSLPEHCTVTVYNRGPALDMSHYRHHAKVVSCPPESGAAGAVLAHLQQDAWAASPHDFLVFTGGDPCRQVPRFLSLLQQSEQWADVQALSAPGQPAQGERDGETSLTLSPERFSLRTLAPLDHFDAPASRLGEAWRYQQGLPANANLLADFLDHCGLMSWAHDARHADLGLQAHGSTWAIRHHAWARMRTGLLAHREGLATALCTNPLASDMLDRCWLHLAGLPFVRLAPLPGKTTTITPIERNLARVVASIDALLAKTERPRQRPLPSLHELLPKESHLRREQQVLDKLLHSLTQSLDLPDGDIDASHERANPPPPGFFPEPHRQRAM